MVSDIVIAIACPECGLGMVAVFSDENGLGYPNYVVASCKSCKNEFYITAPIIIKYFSG